ncbi:TPA: hypothetical protein H2V91_002546 [Salmonella enterica]|nr:hypothetical protein [Salmonella enterica]
MFPAPAGINRQHLLGTAADIGVPRASGDKPQKLSGREVDTSVFPAPAGINLNLEQLTAARKSVPRASGDKPLI